VQEVTSFLESAQALITSQGATDLPANLNTALDEIATVLRELREGGTVENVNATLSSASDAAASIQAAADELPALMDRLNRVLSQAEGTLAGLDEDSQLSREARAALRDIQSAADAVTSLARAIERNPNSLLTGR
jgi:paraquat-inducible protein B